MIGGDTDKSKVPHFLLTHLVHANTLPLVGYTIVIVTLKSRASIATGTHMHINNPFDEITSTYSTQKLSLTNCLDIQIHKLKIKMTPLDHIFQGAIAASDMILRLQYLSSTFYFQLKQIITALKYVDVEKTN